MANKKLIPMIYLDGAQAVGGKDPVALVHAYTERQADEIMVCIVAKDDEKKEDALHTIKKMVEHSSISLIGCGKVARMEDVKKYLYAGCKKAVVSESASNSLELLEEVSKKFGADKIIYEVENPITLKEEITKIGTYASGLLLPEVLVDDRVNALENLEILVRMDEADANQVMQYLLKDGVLAVAGDGITNQMEQLESLKEQAVVQGTSMDFYKTKMAWSTFKLNEDGMIPVIVQDERTNEVLMMAYMNEEAYEMTLKTKIMTYYSRSRNELWVKGDTSGHYQYVKSLQADCDQDTLLAKVKQIGNACHTGAYSCFFQDIITNEYEESNPAKVFQDVFDVILDRKIHPKEGSYTNYLFDKGVDKILKKLGEEATEIVIASKNPDAEEIKYEIADFLYHMMVLMAEKNVTWDDVMKELANR